MIALLTLCWLSAIVSPAAAQETADLLARVNNLRASVGRAPYTWNGALAAAAQSQAQWMAETGNMTHTRPDGSTARTRAAAAGYPSMQVSENIYGGSMAGAGNAWSFWVNSGVHYAGMVNPNYTEIGVGAAHTDWGAAYVLVFGSAAPPPPALVAAVGGGNGGGGQAAVAARISFVVGLDEYGNIMHEVQPDDTLGDIALIYGYTWDDLPAMMQLNEMDNPRELLPGSVFLVPPKNGTYTPTPDSRSPTPSLTPTGVPPSITPFVAVREATATPAPSIAPDIPGIATAAEPPAFLNTPEAEGTPTLTLEVVQVAALATLAAPLTVATTPPGARSTLPVWLAIALGVQGVILVGAGVEFVRRSRRLRRRK